jgi:NitT/TauT family transport system ATP-binding protein
VNSNRPCIEISGVDQTFRSRGNEGAIRALVDINLEIWDSEFVCVLALDSPTLLMDEPFGALDALTRRNLQDKLLRIWMELKKTIVFVTHGIEESVYLADRVVVMTFRPGRIKTVLPVALARPRQPNSPEFNGVEQELTRLVMEEQLQHLRDETLGGGG